MLSTSRPRRACPFWKQASVSDAAQSGISVVLTHPQFGTVYLDNAYLVKTPKGDYVVGEAWDDSDVGGYNLPDDYTGQLVTMNFPAGCIRSLVRGGRPWYGDLPYRELGGSMNDTLTNLIRECADHLDFVEQDLADADLSSAADNARRTMQLAEDVMERIKIRMQVEASR